MAKKRPKPNPTDLTRRNLRAMKELIYEAMTNCAIRTKRGHAERIALAKRVYALEQRAK